MWTFSEMSTSRCPYTLQTLCFELGVLFERKKKKKAVIERESRPQYQRAALRSKPPELMVDPGVHIRCGRSILASLFSRMQNEPVVTLHNVYCLPPIFPEMWRRLEAFEA